MPRRKRREYTPEQKADAIRLVRETGNVAKVCRDLDLTESSVRNWLKQDEIDGRGRFDSAFVGPGDYLVYVSWSADGEYVVAQGVVTLTGQAGPAVLVVDE